jgi:hypothetical protein
MVVRPRRSHPAGVPSLLLLALPGALLSRVAGSGGQNNRPLNSMRESFYDIYPLADGKPSPRAYHTLTLVPGPPQLLLVFGEFAG